MKRIILALILTISFSCENQSKKTHIISNEELNYVLSNIFIEKIERKELFNAKGRQIAYGSGRLYQLVQQAMNNGELRYLNNLLFQNGFWNATDNSQLTPTNQ